MDVLKLRTSNNRVLCSVVSPSQEEKIRQGESRGEHGGSLGEGQITLPFGQGVLRSFYSSVMSLGRRGGSLGLGIRVSGGQGSSL